MSWRFNEKDIIDIVMTWSTLTQPQSHQSTVSPDHCPLVSIWALFTYDQRAVQSDACQLSIHLSPTLVPHLTCDLCDQHYQISEAVPHTSYINLCTLSCNLS